MAEPIGVLIVDDHAVVRHGLRAMLSNVGDVKIVGEAENGAAALQLLTRAQPDVVLLDIRMPGQDGVQLARQMKRLAPRTRVIMLTIHDDLGYASRSLEAGADGYLLKRAGPDELAEAIRTVHRGQRVVAPELASELLGEFAALVREKTRETAGLTSAELKILEGMTRGATNRELANQLFWSEVTVRRKIQEIYRKLNVSDRAEAVAAAIRSGLI